MHLPEIQPNEDGWSDWQLPTRHYRLACCDCGLVHDIEFRVSRAERQPNGSYVIYSHDPTDCVVQFRVRRNNRSTAQVRRHRKRKQSPGESA